MNDRSIDQLLDAWMDLGPTVAPARVAEAARHEARSTRQTASLRGWPPRRFPEMNAMVRLGVAAAIVAAAAVLGFTYFADRNVGDPDPTDSTPSPAGLLNEQEGPLEPGSAYLIDGVPGMRIIVTAPEGWVKNFISDTIWTSGSVAHVGFGTVDNLQANPCVAAEGEMDPPVGPSVSDFVAGLGRLPGLDATSSEVTVSGFPGTHVELTVTDPIDGCYRDADGGIWELPNGEFAPPPGPFARHHFWVVDVQGTRLVISAEIRSAGTLQDQADVDSIIESLHVEATSP
ncbi:MAG TPA: hypothetical protein VF365_02440 [Candidatus Limnocylindria bacterium]